MLVDLFMALAIVAVFAVAFTSLRRKHRLKRIEERSHALYLRTKKRDWLAKWRRQSKTKRLTYRPADADRSHDVGEQR